MGLALAVGRLRHRARAEVTGGDRLLLADTAAKTAVAVGPAKLIHPE